VRERSGPEAKVNAKEEGKGLLLDFNNLTLREREWREGRKRTTLSLVAV